MSFVFAKITHRWKWREQGWARADQWAEIFCCFSSGRGLLSGLKDQTFSSITTIEKAIEMTGHGERGKDDTRFRNEVFRKHGDIVNLIRRLYVGGTEERKFSFSIINE
jgi:hypothetical protein